MSRKHKEPCAQQFTDCHTLSTSLKTPAIALKPVRQDKISSSAVLIVMELTTHVSNTTNGVKARYCQSQINELQKTHINAFPNSYNILRGYSQHIPVVVV